MRREPGRENSIVQFEQAFCVSDQSCLTDPFFLFSGDAELLVSCFSFFISKAWSRCLSALFLLENLEVAHSAAILVLLLWFS